MGKISPHPYRPERASNKVREAKRERILFLVQNLKSPGGGRRKSKREGVQLTRSFAEAGNVWEGGNQKLEKKGFRRRRAITLAADPQR